MERAVFYVICFTLVASAGQSKQDNKTAIEVTTEALFSEATNDSFNVTAGNTTCDSSENETFCNSSVGFDAEDNSTQPSPNEFVPKLSKEVHEYVNVEICSCDLQIRYCDINCCCDEDCTYENKLIFDRCDQDENRVYDTRFCKYAMHIYKNNTPYEWEVNQNGLFCIVKSNLPAEYTVHKKLAFETIDDANLQKTNKYSWLNPDEIAYHHHHHHPNFNESIHYGQNIWLLKNNKTVVPLELPDNFITGACLAKKKATFLNAFETECIQTMIGRENEALRLGHYVENTTIVSISFNETQLKDCPRNVCIALDTKICDEFMENCLNVTNITIHDVKCEVTNRRKSCFNLVKKLKYVFYHNGTYGVKRVEVFAFLQNENFDLDRSVELRQEFEVAYVWFNQSLNYSSMRSGNPGYIDAKFVLIGALHWNVTNTSTNLSITRNGRDIAENFLVFPENKEGVCVLSNSSNVPVEFGYDVILKCRIEKRTPTRNSTAKAVCAKLQSAIFSYWSIQVERNVSKVVGRFGNADASDLNDWLTVWYNVDPKKILNATAGNFTDKNATLTCNLRTVLRVEIFHGREVVGKVHNQEKIIWTSFIFDDGRNVQMDVRSDEVVFKTGLRVEVVFFDVTTHKIRKFADPPSLEIKLPYDFFYPFVKMDSGCASCDRILTMSLFVAFGLLNF